MEKATLIYNPCFTDNRGVFAPLPLIFGDSKIEILRKNWIQSNISYNPKKGTFRGMHLQLEPYVQAKLVKVINGSIIDFVVDLREDSEDYLKVQHFYVSNNEEVYVPRGFAHGFITTEDNTVVQYLVDNNYSKSAECSIKWDSIPEIKNIVSSVETELIISEKDENALTMSEHLEKFANTVYVGDGFEWQGKDKETIHTSNLISVVAGLSIIFLLTVLIILNFINE